VPPAHVRELRALISHRQRLLRARTQGRNRLHSLIHRYNLTPPAGDLFAAKQREWWVSLELSVTERLRVDQDLSTLDHLAQHVATVEAELHRLSTTVLGANQVPDLVQLPGIGLITAMILLSAIGDVTRFGAAQQLVGYAGLGAGVHSSGKTDRTGRITKEGRRELRWGKRRGGAYRWHEPTPTGSGNSRGWSTGSAKRKRSSRSRASCWW
jgi:transposase